MMIEMVVLGTMTLTSYQPIPAQTKPECVNRFHCTTSTGDGITMYGAAASQDLLKSGRLHYGDIIFVPGFGYRVINDCMNKRLKNSIDLMVFSREEEKRVGVRRVKIYRMEEPKYEIVPQSERYTQS